MIKVKQTIQHKNIWNTCMNENMVNILMGSTFRNEYMYKDTKKICKRTVFEEVHEMLWAIPPTKFHCTEWRS